MSKQLSLMNINSPKKRTQALIQSGHGTFLFVFRFARI